ncbi:hypothetical protein [Rhodoferax mekongensis]|uniref:hypothetical protein n=1 Tax=Rhodoferax mekongensis TaxID=3068341 RepID=UPI0028BE7121|nr:hypothetical protein [Rhodoferax sp. TBRC 17199]MDT7517026.1 hypothetical protein [Rhodoferax sp. TBRC 17199]
MNRHTQGLNLHSPASLRALQALKSKGSADQPETVQRELGGTTSLLVLMALVLVIPVLMVIRLDPRVDRWIANKGKPPLEVGTVQSIQFVGRLGGLDTQINTDQRTLLVGDAAAIPKGTALEWRRSDLYGDLCVVGTERCWDLLVVDETERSPHAKEKHPSAQ